MRNFGRYQGTRISMLLLTNHRGFKWKNIPQELSAKLPATTIPAKIFYRDKVWDLPCAGDQANKKFGIEEWGKFMTENDVKLGDACVFELMEGDSKSRVKFKVQILKDDFPLELLEKADGFSMNNPIDID
uniref:Putative DNA-binding pseudobarrel domain-containing protein n=1 Tax=Helianthus annuus TaxID=4232 RepID=A0A251VQR5_HELAN